MSDRRDRAPLWFWLLLAFLFLQIALAEADRLHRTGGATPDSDQSPEDTSWERQDRW